ncbi:cysteine hydrolase family protein [Streptomyces sp. NPDC060065]|uniref:cysteine hydrolase family protein n=1 Tax=Streptomyces sp. NPDC060065 TaxID=3347050 RepID=UPI0036C9FE39
MPSPESSTALLVLDFQAGLTEKPFAKAALGKAVQAVEAARRQGLLVVYSRVGFRSGYSDVASWNPVFGPYAAQNLLPVGASKLAPELSPAEAEPVVVKSRFSPFAGTDLTVVLRSQGISEIAVAGISTSGVVLAAFLHAENEDLPVTVLKDACGDPDEQLHDTLVEHLFPRSAVVTAVDDWQPSQTQSGSAVR